MGIHEIASQAPILPSVTVLDGPKARTPAYLASQRSYIPNLAQCLIHYLKYYYLNATYLQPLTNYNFCI